MIALIIMAALVCEALVEYFKTIMKMIENGEYKTAITQGFTILLGILLAFIFKTQMFNEVCGTDINPTIDMILTGILFSRGSNYISDFIKKLTDPKVVVADDVFNPDDIQIMVGDGADMVTFLKGEEK